MKHVWYSIRQQYVRLLVVLIVLIVSFLFSRYAPIHSSPQVVPDTPVDLIVMGGAGYVFSARPPESGQSQGGSVAAAEEITPRPASLVTNLLANGDFETGGLASWENNGGITVSAAAAYEGIFGAQMATNGRIDHQFGTTPGQTYYVSARIRINQQLANPSWGGLRVQIVNSSWSPLATSPNLTTTNSPAGQWTHVYFSFVANTTQSRLIYQNFSGGGQFNASADAFIVSTDPIPDDPQATTTPTPLPTFTPTPTPIPPTATPTPTATPILPTATTGPTATFVVPTFTPTPTSTDIPPTHTPDVTATPSSTPTATPIPTATTPSSVAVLEPFEQPIENWLIFSDSSGTGSVTRSATVAAAGSYAAQLATTNGGSAAARVNFSAPAGSWGESPGIWHWQWANLYLPATTIAQLGPTEYITIAGFWANGQNNRGWYLRVRQGGELYAYGFTPSGNAVEFRLYGTFPADQWVDLEIGLHSQNGPGIKRGFAFLLNGMFYGWYHQGNMIGETFDRVALGILSTNSPDPLSLYVDDWRILTSAPFPGGPDQRSTANLQVQDFRNQSGVQWQIDWSSWEWDLRLDPVYGLYSAASRVQGGRNLDKMPELSSGWGEIEIDWPNGTPPTNPNSYFGPMIGFRKNASLEENLEIIPIGLGNGQVNLALEAWVNGGPIILTQWPLPLASIGSNSHIPESGDVIRVRWEEIGTQLNIWASYFDSSSNTWYSDIIIHTLNLTNIGGVNFADGRHLASTLTIDSQYYSIRRYTVGTLDSYPGLPTATPTATPLPTLAATSTPLPPTLTPTLTPTNVPPTATSTNTPLPPTATATDTPIAPTFTPTPTPSPLPPTATPTNTPTPTPIPPTATPSPETLVYVSSTSGGTAGGVSFADEDILVYSLDTGIWNLYFDGSDVGLGGVDVGAFDLLSDGTILIAVDVPVTLPDVGAIDDSDIVRFIPTSLGSTTAGTYEWYFDGSDVGLTTNAEDIDALDVLSDGRVVVSTLGAFGVAGVSGQDEDLIAFTPTTLGSTTSGDWAMYYDGSDVELSQASSEDTNGVWVATNGDVYITVLGAFAVTGVTGDGADILRCVPGSLGNNTVCVYSLYWDGSDHGFAGEVADGFAITQP